MAYIFVNLKRFEVPRQIGGLCPIDDPQVWIADVVQTSIDLGLGRLPEVQLTYLLPEGVVCTALQILTNNPLENTRTISIGCQGVHWRDIEPGQNFGAFTTSLPARAAAALGCNWSIIGHSEERRAKLQIIEAYDPHLDQNPASYDRALDTVNGLIRDEVHNALAAGLKVLLCVGETASERGEGNFTEQKPRIQAILKKQLTANLRIDREFFSRAQVVIGYEPVWAIGPGKIPPDADYITFVSEYIKQTVRLNNGFNPVVVYGGGLKEENAALIAGIKSIGGGLVALTRFSGEIGFYVDDLKLIIDKFLEAQRS